MSNYFLTVFLIKLCESEAEAKKKLIISAILVAAGFFLNG